MRTARLQRPRWTTVALLCASTACSTARPNPVDSGATHDAPLDDAPNAADAPAVSAQCANAAANALSSAAIDLYQWDGEAPTSATIATDIAEACGAFHVDAPWVSLERTTSALTVRVDGASLPTGSHRAELSFVGVDGSVLSRASVRYRLFRRPAAGAQRRALVVGYDGTRPDALELARTPALDFLRRRARFTMDARTQLAGPTVSAPGWMSVFTGVDPEHHRVVANGQYAMRDERYRTFVARAIDAGRTAIVSTAWEEVTAQIVERSLTLERSYLLDPYAARWLAQRLRTGSESLFFQHLNAPDEAGHANGFSVAVPSYVQAIERCDSNLAVLLDAVLSRATIDSEDWLIVLTTDHGGAGTSHGALDDDNRRIWFVAAGPSITEETLPAGVSHMDTAPTVLRWLGVTIDPAWQLQGVSRVD